jgi:hypothetical protein
MQSGDPPRDDRPDPIGRFGAAGWRWLASPVVLQAILALLLVATLLAGVLPQTTPQAGADEARWRLEARARWGRAFDVAEALGVHDVYDSLPYRLLLAALGITAAVRLVGLWAPRWSLPPRHGLSTRRINEPAQAEGDASLARALDAEGLRLVPLGAQDGLRYSAIADRPARRALAGLVYLGVVLLLTAGLMERRLGWEGPVVEVALGEEGALDPAAGLAARLDQIEVRGTPGPNRRLLADFSLWEDGSERDGVRVGPGRPAATGPYLVYLLGQGPAARVEAEGAGGERLPLTWIGGAVTAGDTVRVRFPAAEQEQVVALSGTDRLLEMVHYPSLAAEGIDGPVIHALLREGADGEVLAEGLVTEAGVLDGGDLRVRLTIEYYVRVRAEREPHLPVAALGALALLAGVLGQALWPPRRGWLVTEERADAAHHLLLGPGDGWAERVARATGERE